MRKLKGQEGYALVLVLFLIVFIITVSAVFMRGSLSNANQEQIVDKNGLSVASAEMGVDYYKLSFLNLFTVKKTELIDSAQKELTFLYENSNKLTDTVIKNREYEIYKDLRESMRSLFEELIIETNAEKKVDGESLKFVGKNFGVKTLLEKNDLDFRQVEINGTVIGRKKGAKPSELQFKMLFELPKIIYGSENNNGDSNGDDNGEDNQIPPPPTPTGEIMTKWPCTDKDCNYTIKN
ncbi:hypothetical protein, partial [Sporosarcina newyorkensis]